MKVRCKKTKVEMGSNTFNTTAVCPVEVLTGDDSWFVSDLEVWLEQKQEWKDMRQAFKDHDLITDNYNVYFFEPHNKVERKRGYSL